MFLRKFKNRDFLYSLAKLCVWILPPIFLFFSIVSPSFERATPKDVFTPKKNEASLFPYLHYLEDSDRTLSFEDVLKQKRKFLSIDRLSNPNYTSTVYWMSFSIDLREFPDAYFIIKKPYRHLGSMSIYYPTPAGKGYDVISIEENEPAAARAIKTRDFFFKVPNTKNISTFYARIDPRSNLLRLDIAWDTVSSAIENVAYSESWNGIFFGGLLILLFYNLVLWGYTQNKAYFFYIYYLACFIGTFYNLVGYNSLFTNIPTSLFLLCVYGTLHGITLFVRSFLDLRASGNKNIKFLNILLIKLKWLLLTGAFATPFLVTGHAYKLSVLMIFIVIPIVIATALVRASEGYFPAQLFLFGWTMFAWCIVVYCLQLFGVFPINVETISTLKFAAMWEAVLFSLSLGYQIRLADKAAKHAQNAFLGMLGHELRSPLQIITSSIDVVRFKFGSLPEINRLETASKHLEMQMRDISDYSRLDAGLLELRMSEFDLVKLTVNVIEEFNPLASKKMLTLKLDLGNATSRIAISDPTRIKQILSNLLSNAIKFTPADGVVTLQVDCRDDAIIFTVRDTGIGIPEESISEVIKPFKQLEQSNARKNDGAGLGLAIVSNLIKLLRGELTIVSGKRGSNFSVVIPVQFSNTSIPKR